jgi:tricorn protease-like protein
LALNRDGTLLASGSLDDSVNVWDTVKGKPLKRFKGTTRGLASIDLTSDGKALVTGDDEGVIRIWNTVTGRCNQTLEGHKDGVRAVRFMDGAGMSLLSAGSPGPEKGEIVLWSLPKGKPLKRVTWPNHGVWSAAVSRDGAFFACGAHDLKDRGEIRLWDAKSASEIAVLRGHRSLVTGVTISGDGKLLASGSLDGEIKLWDLSAHKEMCSVKGHTDGLDSVAFSPDGRYLASAGGRDGLVKVWDAKGLRNIWTYNDQMRRVRVVLWSPGGKELYGGIGESSDGLKRAVLIWEWQAILQGTNGGKGGQ